jgi:hypothetical protein
LNALSAAYGLFRFATRLQRFVRDPLSVAAAQTLVRDRLNAREPAFLAMIERTVFGRTRSPYLCLFRAAGCEFGDVKRLVEGEGVEGALCVLYRAGIYVSFREFKGQASARRGSQSFQFRESDFDNVALDVAYSTRTGGSRGRPSRILIDLDYLADMAPHWALWFAAHGWLTRPLVFVSPTYPGIVNRQLRCIRFGKPFVRWFSTGEPGSWPYRLVAGYLHALVRWHVGVPRPERTPLAEITRVAEALGEMTAAGNPPCVVTSPSTATRITLAIQERGGNLRRLAFLLGGEALTEARCRAIEAAGAVAVSTYGFAEAGSVGAQCPHPTAVDDVHVFGDGFAVIGETQDREDREPSNALAITTLRPACPKVMLNTEIGDCGVIVTRPCSCSLGQIGYTRHLHTIRSYEKLTGEGVTLRVADLFHLIEEVIPARFGGSLADYQFVEQQDPRGLPRYTLLVNPALGPVDETALAAVILKELAGLRRPYPFMVDQWRQGGGIRVRRALPVLTPRGKLLPVRTLAMDDSVT